MRGLKVIKPRRNAKVPCRFGILLLSACQYFSGVTPPTPQGNTLTAEVLQQLRVNMTQRASALFAG